MKNRFLLFILFYTSSFFGNFYTQMMYVEGHVVDQNNQPVFSANVIALNPIDSSIIKGLTTNLEGYFRLNNLDTGKVIVKISFIGYEDVFITQTIQDSSLSLGKIKIISTENKLIEIKVLGTATPVIQMGDTTQINANAFKTNPDATVEDLVTKMPGITIQDGQIQAQGEKVRKVLVDGKEYFGDDASAVLKNLPAEVVDKIQIFDKMSEQSELTGFDDGESYKTINIVTKAEFREGTFGRAYGGYGPDDKWNSGFNLNLFNEKRRITLLGNSNNINNQNFSSEDLSGIASSGSSSDRKGGRSGGSENNFLVNSKNGITTTNAFGINYDQKIKNITVNGSYFFNRSDNVVVNRVYREYVTNENVGLYYTENQENKSQNSNHRLNFRFDWKIDSLNSILFQPKITIQKNKGNRYLTGENSQLNSPISLLNNVYLTDLDGISISTPLLIRHRFTNKRRSLSLNLTPAYNKNIGINNLNSFTFLYDELVYSDSLNQNTNQQNNGFSINSNLVYTEPLGPKSQLMISYKNRYTQNYSNKETYNYSPIDDSFNQFDTTLSNNFNSNYLSNSLGMSYRKNVPKWNIAVGLDYQIAQLLGDQLFPNSFNVNRTFKNILPNARFQYKFSKTKNLRINYRSQNSVPSINQLQNVINNNNPLQLSTGNPDLLQDWQNTISLQYSSVNTPKLKSFFTMLSGTFTKNYIVKNTFIADFDTLIAPGIVLSRGGQLTSPTNLDGYFNIRNFNNYGIAIKKIKSNFSVNLGTLYSRTPGLVNNELNYANTFNIGLGIALTSNISENIDFSFSSNTSYNNITNTLRTNLNTVFYNQNSKFKIQLFIKKRIVLQTELNHQFNTGLSENFNQNYLLWNAAIAMKIFKNRQGEFRLSVYDIMNQNTNINRFITETYFEDIQNNVLNRYFLATFSYTIKYFKKPKTESH